ncbi:MAG: hypothetical protein J7524_23385, partial [Roseofilum sp. Belize BBD 4]
FFAGMLDSLTFGISTFARRLGHGEAATRNHHGLFFNLGRFSGSIASIWIGAYAAPFRGFQAAPWWAKAALGYDLFGAGIGIAQSSANIMQGKATWWDILPFLPILAWSGAKLKLGSKKVSYGIDGNNLQITPTGEPPTVSPRGSGTITSTEGIPDTLKLTGRLQADNWTPPPIQTNRHGKLTNGSYTLDTPGMNVHTTGTLALGKSQFLHRVNYQTLVLDAASYADEANLWQGSKAKVVLDRPIGVHASTGQPTNVLNIYRNKNNFVHGAPGSPL